MTWLHIALAFIIGAWCGMAVMAVLAARRDDDE